MAAKKTQPQQPKAEPSILWKPDTTVPRKGRIEILNAPIGYIIGYGDGMRDANVPNNVYYHTYPQEGPYTITIKPTGSQVPTVFKPIRVLDQSAPNVDITAPEEGATIRVTFTDPPGMPMVPRYTIYWSRSEHEDVLPEPGQAFERYVSEGTYPIQVVDHWSGLQKLERLEVGPYVQDPEFTLTEDTTDPERYTVKLEVTRANQGGVGKTFNLDWGEGGSTEQIAAQVGTTVSHAFYFDGAYNVLVSYTDDPDTSRLHEVTVPFASEA